MTGWIRSITSRKLSGANGWETDWPLSWPSSRPIRNFVSSDWTMAIVQSDETKLRIGRLEGQLSGQSVSQPFAPDSFRDVIDRIHPVIETGAHHSNHRREPLKGRNVVARGADIGFQIGGDEPRMGLDAIEHARQKRLFHAAIAQPSDRGYRDRNHQDHRDG